MHACMHLFCFRLSRDQFLVINVLDKIKFCQLETFSSM
uniref:Uncharacterized protein n=1 Tax=Arundo donax TaxID=35708 RepID=A0A0A9BA13_ARUDO